MFTNSIKIARRIKSTGDYGASGGNRTYTERARIVLSTSTKGVMFAWFNKMRFQKFLSTAPDTAATIVHVSPGTAS